MDYLDVEIKLKGVRESPFFCFVGLCVELCGFTPSRFRFVSGDWGCVLMCFRLIGGYFYVLNF